MGAWHACAIDRETRGVWCWGDNGQQQLGDGTRTDSITPVRVDDGGAFRLYESISAGRWRTCGLTQGGDVFCWGEVDSTPTRVEMPDELAASAVDVGSGHECAVLEDGTVACWGLNGEGQLGRGHTDPGAGVRRVLDVTDAVAIGLGAQHSCARTRRNEVYCWGRNIEGQHGVGDRVNNSTPELVPLFQTAP
jgi:alpha-tubulin suppressor-like RCC1 family protein